MKTNELRSSYGDGDGGLNNKIVVVVVVVKTKELW